MSGNGAPTLLSGAAPTSSTPAARSDSAASQQGTKSDWGLYLEGAKIIEPDSILSLDYQRDWALADYPLEQGAFSTYDKVARPFDVHLRMTKGGSEQDRRGFLAAIETIAGSLALLDVVTPERTYLSVNIQRLGLQRTAFSGVGLLTVDVGLRQIRVTASAGFTAATVQSPGSADPVNGGRVQPQPTPPAVAAPALAKVKKALAPASAVGAPSH